MLRDAAPMIAAPTPRKNIAVNEDIVSMFRLRIMLAANSYYYLCQIRIQKKLLITNLKYTSPCMREPDPKC